MKDSNFLAHKPLGAVIKTTLLQQPLLVIVLFVVTMGVIIVSLLPPQILRMIIDNNLLLGTAEGLPFLVGSYVSVLILIGFLDLGKSGLLVIIGQKLVKQLRLAMSLKLQKLRLQYFTNHSAAEITSGFTNDIDNVNSLFADGLISLFIDLLKVVGIVASVAFFSWPLALIVVAVIPLIFFITRLFQQRMLQAQEANLQQLSLVNNHIAESLKNFAMIKTYGKEQFMEQLYAQKLEDNFKTIGKVNFYDSCYAPIIQIIRAVVIAVVVLLAAPQLNFLGISLGMVAASIDLIANLFLPIEAVGMELQSIQKGWSGIQRINQFLDREEMTDPNQQLTATKILAIPQQQVVPSELHQQQAQSTVTAEGQGQAGAVSVGASGGLCSAGFVFRHLTFAYDKAVEPVLQDINLVVPLGQQITFVGRTGVGKSTLLKLIMGLEKPTSGSLTLNGVELSQIPNRQKRRLLGYVEQNFAFIQGTVAEQISLADEQISMQQVSNAVAFVGLGDYVNSLADGLNTPVLSSKMFSQGQKQLLAIARAIVTDPPILLLDEITANLDSATEENVVRILSKAENNRTIFSVSHRIASMLRCDRVVILEEGKIRLTGSPQDLLQQDAWFRQLTQTAAGKHPKVLS